MTFQRILAVYTTTILKTGRIFKYKPINDLPLCSDPLYQAGNLGSTCYDEADDPDQRYRPIGDECIEDSGYSLSEGSYIENGAIVGSPCDPVEFCSDPTSTDPVVRDHCEDIWTDVDECILNPKLCKNTPPPNCDLDDPPEECVPTEFPDGRIMPPGEPCLDDALPCDVPDPPEGCSVPTECPDGSIIPPGEQCPEEEPPEEEDEEAGADEEDAGGAN